MWRSILAAVVLTMVSGSAWAQTTSENDPRLARLLERRPEADANGDKILTQAEARAFIQAQRGNQPQGQNNRAQRRRGPGVQPTFANLSYGPNERHVIDLYLAPGKDGAPRASAPTPLVIFIHGGGFVGGDKKQINGQLLRQMHAAGISMAAIHYRFVTTDPMPACFGDAARAVQFLRHHATEYNLDPTRFAATGGSAGAGISLWLAFHDDLADAKSDDPIARQSTRLSCAVVNGAQVSYDPHDWRAMGLTRGLEHRSFSLMYGAKDGENDDTPRIAALAKECAPINHFDKTDAPVYMTYGVPNEITDTTPMNALIHHPIQGLTLKKKMDAAGIECIVIYRGGPEPPMSAAEFLVKYLKPTSKSAD